MTSLVAYPGTPHATTMWAPAELGAKNYPQRASLVVRDQYLVIGRVHLGTHAANIFGLGAPDEANLLVACAGPACRQLGNSWSMQPERTLPL
jgi:hypothetical protein